MTRDELADACQRAIDTGLSKVMLVIPGPPPRGERIRIAKGRHKCPMGETASWQDNPPRAVAWFNAADVLEWLKQNA